MDKLKNLDWNIVRDKLASFASSQLAQEQLLELAPQKTQHQAEKIAQQILEVEELLTQADRPRMESLDLCGTWLDRLRKKAIMRTLDLRDIRSFLLDTSYLQSVLDLGKSPWLKELKAQIMDFKRPLSAIDQLIGPNGEIRTDASERLYSLHNEKINQGRRVQSILENLVRQHHMENTLQDNYVTTREGRCVLPVKSGAQHDLKGIIHASSQSKQTVYMEPEEVIPLNNRLRQIEVEIEEEIENLLHQITDYLCPQVFEFEACKEILILSDMRFAQAQLAKKLEATSCIFSNRIHLKELRHPILVFNQDKVIGNPIDLDQKKSLLLLSGPNAGGKTVLLKSIGLAAQMARCGLPICAQSGSELPFFEGVTTAIGDAQNVDDHLSTFAAHLKVLDECAHLKGQHQLLLIDEICGSTDPEEGSALARAFIERFAENQVFGVITSHLGPLKTGWTEETKVINGSMEYNSQTGSPTYNLLMGVAGQSLALETARRVGVDKALVDRALDLLGPDRKHFLNEMQEIQKMKSDIIALNSQLKSAQHKAHEEKRRYQQLIEKFRQEKDQWLSKIIKKGESQVEELIQKSKAADIFKKHEELGRIKMTLPEIVKKEASGSAARNYTTADEFSQAYPPGSKVYIKSLNRDGVLQGKPNSKGELPVLTQSMRMMIHWQDLNPLITPFTSNEQQFGHRVHVAFGGGDRVVDLRGAKSEEAIERLEMQLDAAATQNEDRVKIIHGHGTEALKKAVRNYLSRSIYVKKWSAGQKENGGDGVTWVEIKD